MLSILRVAMLYKVFASVIMVFSMLNQVYIMKRLLLENIKDITIRFLQGILLLHIATCAWIMLLFTEDEYKESFALFKANIHESIVTTGSTGGTLEFAEKFYIDALYFMTTTMTTVGYGDIKGLNIYEQLFLCVVIFCGIAMFTLITGQVLGYKKEPTVEDFAKIINSNVKDLLINLSQIRTDKWFHKQLYEECKTVIEEAQRYSTQRTFDNYFWATLPP